MRIMGASRVNSHNSHPGSQKRNWRVGNVRGALEVERSLELDERRIRASLGSTFALVSGVALTKSPTREV